MKNYNIVIIECKQCIPFLNLTKQEFYDKLWEWTYKDNLWDYLKEYNPTEEDLRNVLDEFINENMFHKYQDDDLDCFAFVNTEDGIKEYQTTEELFEFIYTKIKEHNDKD